jgi:hypothetical protein
VGDTIVSGPLENAQGGRDMPRKTYPAELISRGVRLAVSETLAAHYSPTQMDRLFGSEGWELDPFDLDLQTGRRGRVDAYERQVDFASPDDAEAYLVLVARVLARMNQAEAGETWDDKKAPFQIARDRIEGELSRAGCVEASDGTWHLPARVEPSAALLAADEGSGIARITAAMRRPDCDPEERIGLAKELVEAVIKTALSELGEAYDRKDDIPALSKRLNIALKLDDAVTLAPDADGEQRVRRLLSGLTTIPHTLAELRNPYGSGHGRAERVAGIALLADLAARAADAYATFVLDLLEERRNR